MKLYFTFTRKTAAALLASILLCLLILGDVCSGASVPKNADTHQKRMEFLQSIGIEVNEDSAEVKTLIIPESFSSVYNNYNELQKKSGFDLARYKGCEAVQYTYEALTSENTFVHLLVYNGRVIGGDIAETALNGNMIPLYE